MAIFPPSPNPGDQVSDANSGATWRWSGPPANRWDAVALGRGGVTDGSNAGPGEIGEFFVAKGSRSTAPTLVWESLVSLSLPAGDWDVNGSMEVTGTASVTSVACVIQDNTAYPPPDSNRAALLPPAGVTQWGGTAMPQRFSSASPITAHLIVYAAQVGGTAHGQIQARRVR